jgi:hypothetical protein
MRGRAFTLIDLVVLLAACAAAGCGNAPDGRQRISGTITLKGVPLDEGLIEFIPKAETGSGVVNSKTPDSSSVAGKEIATRSGALIKDGRYVIPQDKGLLPGTYKVVISSVEGNAPEATPGVPPGPTKKGRAKDRIPADYNRTTKQIVEVTKEGPNEFNYTIP